MINKKDIFDKVYTKTYYLGESRKIKNPDEKIVQASTDNDDVLNDYLEEAFNNLDFYAQKRLFQVILTETGVEVESERPKKDRVVPILEKQIQDYMVEYLCYKWMSDNGADISPQSYEEALDKVKDCICSLAPIVRRRPTEMGV